jgi:SAM-dependent methyltransferase
LILDIGCGFSTTGNLEGDALRYHAKPRGDVNIDIGIPEIRIPNFLMCDAENLCFRDEIFDKTLISHVLEHLKNPGGSLKEIRRVLRTDGVLCASVPNRYGEWSEADPSHLWHWNLYEFHHFIETYFPTSKKGVGGGSWIPLRGNKKIWGKSLIKLFPYFANEVKVTAWKT